MAKYQSMKIRYVSAMQTLCIYMLCRDGSAVYGNDIDRSAKVRTFKDGKLKLGEDGLLLHKSDGIPVSGDIRNSWAGLSILQALFIKEHNAVCDMLKVTISL